MPGFKIIGKWEPRRGAAEVNEDIARKNPFAPFPRPPLEEERGPVFREPYLTKELERFLDLGEGNRPATRSLSRPTSRITATDRSEVNGKKGDWVDLVPKTRGGSGSYLPVPSMVLILEALAEAPGYGMQIIERIAQRTQGQINLKAGALNPRLSHLLKNKIIEKTNGEQSLNLPERIYYRLTPYGKCILEEGRLVYRLLYGEASPSGPSENSGRENFRSGSDNQAPIRESGVRPSQQSNLDDLFKPLAREGRRSRTSISPKFILVHILNHGAGYGYDLAHRASKMTSGKYNLPFGALYPALQELLREGLIEATSGEQRGDMSERRIYYQLTPKGINFVAQTREALAPLLMLKIPNQ